MGVFDRLFGRKEKLNRHGRRSVSAMEAKKQRKKWLAGREKHIEDVRRSQRNGLEFRLNKVRKRTFERKGRCNNQRFSF